MDRPRYQWTTSRQQTKWPHLLARNWSPRKSRRASLESVLSLQLRWLLAFSAIEPGATFCCLVRELSRRWQALDFSCHKLRSVAWGCDEISTFARRNGCWTKHYISTMTWQITPIKNNYNGATPDPAYISRWRLTLDGVSSGLTVSLDIGALSARHQVHDQITRLVCVEGWSAIAWWSGLRFDELLHAYPPVSQAKWAHIESSVNLDADGNPDPYFVSIDLSTAQHPQTLLATHLNGKPLTVEHGAPLRLLVPVKLGLKNIKAITRITYTKDEPPDYWAKRGYSRYDGI